MKTAVLLYNDRVESYRHMVHLDSVLDTRPTPKAVADMADTRIRNLMAFRELQHFNDTGNWLYVHPFIAGKSEYMQLVQLFRSQPDEFLRRHHNVCDNIKRYRSYLKRQDRLEMRSKDKETLVRYTKRKELYELVVRDLSPQQKQQPSSQL